MVTNTNKYDFALFLLVISQFGGVLGGAFQFTRIVAFILLPLLIGRTKRFRYTNAFLGVFISFWLYCALSLLWTPDTAEGIKMLFYWIVHFLISLEVIVFALYAKRPLNSIAWGWVCAVLICSMISIWEITTLEHLENAKERESQVNLGEGQILTRFYTMATFFNPNQYVTFLCFSLPWLIYQIEESHKKIEKIICLIAIVLAIFDILCDASRGGLLTSIVITGIYFIMSKKSLIKVLSFFVIVIPLVYFIITRGEIYLAVILGRISGYGLLEGESRFVVWLGALKAFLDTYGFGVGIGGMDAALRNYLHGEIFVTHNLLLEFLVQYGLLFTVVFLSFLWKLIKKSLKMKSDNRRLVVLMALITLPIYSIVNSNYLGMPQLYIFFSTIYLFVNYERIKFVHKGLFLAS